MISEAIKQDVWSSSKKHRIVLKAHSKDVLITVSSTSWYIKNTYLKPSFQLNQFKI